MKDSSSSRDHDHTASAKPQRDGEMTPGQHLQAIHAAFFNGGGWLDGPLTWDDYAPEQHAEWEALAEGIGDNMAVAWAGRALLAALNELLGLTAIKSHPAIDRARAAIATAIGRPITPPPPDRQTPADEARDEP